jgi:8-oxo-dGTP pyrophosphatase MutT (NUDIX family)/phage gp37-like protein/GNAT superfamily N-acetyltransferase
MRAREFTEPQAAGCVLKAADTGRWCLQKRSDSVSDPGVWSTWGGGRESGETLEQTVRRELAEEGGYTGPLRLEPLMMNQRYATYIGHVPHEFEPQINNEVKDWCWVEPNDLPSPLHPGLKSALRKLTVTESKLTESAIFLNPNTVIVGQAHGQPLDLSPETLKKVQAIAAKHGAWYEGNGADVARTQGQINRYVGSWDDEVAKTASPNDPKWLYVLFANVDENNRVNRVGVNPKDTIFNQLLANAKDNSFQNIGFTSQALQQFLSMASQGKYDFVKMSQQPATQENLTRFLKTGEALMWPSNWEQYPNRAGKIAKAATVDVRDRYLATRKAGVYVTGSGHLKAVQNITGQQGVAENFADDQSKKITFNTQKGKNKFATTMMVNNAPVGVYQYNADTGRSIAEIYPEYKGQGLGKLLVLNAIYTAAKLGLDFVEDESRTAEYDNVLDSLSSNGYIVSDDGYLYVTSQGEQYLKQSLKQGVAENFADGKNPGRKGLSRRVGIPKKASLTQLQKIASSSTGERRRMAQWQLNMRRGKARKNK